MYEAKESIINGYKDIVQGKFIESCGNFIEDIRKAEEMGLENGEIVSVSDASGITPSTGYVCVYSNISGNTWTTPEIKIESTVKIGDYPVGYCQMNNNVPALTQYRVAMAIIMITGNCPVNATT